MTKFLLFLSMAALLGASIIGFLNKSTYDRVHEQRIAMDQQKNELHSQNEQLVQELETNRKAAAQAKAANQQAKANHDLAADDLRRRTKDYETLRANYEAKKAELAEYAVLEEKLKGRSVEQIKAEFDRLTQEKASLDKERGELENQWAKVQDLYHKNEDKIGELDKRELKRREQLALSGIEADIIAINREFGFVILNAGSEQGVSPDSGLLVQRGVDRIGRLRIVSVEPQITVADIVPGSVNPGVQLMVRDKVIFESR